MAQPVLDLLGDQLTVKQLLDIPDAAMDQAMGIAYQLYLAGRLTEAATVCRGLIACDHRSWWPYSLHASVLRRLAHHEEALATVDEGLRYEPRQPKLLLMRAELLITLARKKSALARPESAGSTSSPADPPPEAPQAAARQRAKAA